jgi:hypothetical protein
MWFEQKGLLTTRVKKKQDVDLVHNVYMTTTRVNCARN